MSKNKKQNFINTKSIKFEIVSARKSSIEKIRSEICKMFGADIEIKAISPEQYIGEQAGAVAIMTRASSWEGSYFPYVMIRDTDSIKTAKSKELRKRIDKEQELFKTLADKTDAANFSSKLAGCPKCESRVNRKYITNSTCPVCGESLRSKSARDALIKKLEKISRLKAELEKELMRNANNAPLRYLVAIPERNEQ